MNFLNFIAADLGNSRIKLFINCLEPGTTKLKKEYVSFSYSEDKDWINAIMEIFTGYSGSRIDFCYSSVNITKLENLLSHLAEIKGIRFKDASDMIDRSGIIDFGRAEGMGTDRMLGLFGALKYCSPPFITIDAGTAITINAIDWGSRFLGGAIMPGIFTQIKSLAASASGLSAISLKAPVKASGLNTKEAMRSGILTGSFGAIKEIIDRMEKEEFAEKPVPVIATGGTIELLKLNLAGHFSDFRVVKHLVLEGIEYLYSSVDNT